MKLNRCLAVLLILGVTLQCTRTQEEEESRRGLRLPRWLRVFSKGPHPDDDTYEGKQIFNHVDNVLQGGTIGVEVNLKKQVRKLKKWWDKVKHSLPAMRRFRQRFHPEGREVENNFPAEGAGIDPRKTFNNFRSDRLWEPVDPQKDQDHGEDVINNIKQ